jgi:hypothetical protein
VTKNGWRRTTIGGLLSVVVVMKGNTVMESQTKVSKLKNSRQFFRVNYLFNGSFEVFRGDLTRKKPPASAAGP